MAFNFFKKKKLDYDPLNIKVTDLRKGFILEYDLKEWEVLAEYTYDWGNNYFSKEFKIQSSTEIKFLSIEEDDELEVILYDKIKISDIDGDIAKTIINDQIPPVSITYKGIVFKREDESPGYFLEEGSGKDWSELVTWEYYEVGGKRSISIEQWGDREFEAAIGIRIQTYEINNILPA